MSITSISIRYLSYYIFDEKGDGLSHQALGMLGSGRIAVEEKRLIE